MLNGILTGLPAFGVAWQENHSNAVIARGWQFETELRTFLTVKFVRNLNQDTGAIAGLGIRTDSTAMGQIDQNLQPLLNDGMAFLAFDIGDETDAAGIMFVAAIVKALILRKTRRRDISV